MGTWIELRCEDRCDDARKNCWSDVNAGPMDLADDTLKSAAAVIRSLYADAKKAGWKRIADGWICKNCAERRAQASALGNKGGEHG